MSIYVAPDWSKLYLQKVAEKDLIGFRFKGEGWYFDKTGGALFVSKVEGGSNKVRHSNPNDPVYQLSYWYSSPIEEFMKMIAARVVEDKRPQAIVSL